MNTGSTEARVTQLLSAAASEQRAQRPLAALQLLQQVVEIEPNHPQALNSLGTYALSQREFARARDMFARAAASDPREPVLWLNVARACRELADDDGDLDALDRILAIDARFFMALLRKAHLMQRQGQTLAAATLWGQAGMVAPPADQLTPELQTMLADGQRFADEQNAKFADALDDQMADARASASPGSARRVDAAIDAMLGRRRI